LKLRVTVDHLLFYLFLQYVLKIYITLVHILPYQIVNHLRSVGALLVLRRKDYEKGLQYCYRGQLDTGTMECLVKNALDFAQTNGNLTVEKGLQCCFREELDYGIGEETFEKDLPEHLSGIDQNLFHRAEEKHNELSDLGKQILDIQNDVTHRFHRVRKRSYHLGEA